MLLGSLSPSLTSYCFRIKCHISETALNSQFSTLVYFEYFISCIELSFPDIGILNSVWTMCCHTCFLPYEKKAPFPHHVIHLESSTYPCQETFFQFAVFLCLGLSILSIFDWSIAWTWNIVMFIILCLLYTVVSSWRREPLADSSQFLRT